MSITFDTSKVLHNLVKSLLDDDEGISGDAWAHLTTWLSVEDPVLCTNLLAVIKCQDDRYYLPVKELEGEQ